MTDTKQPISGNTKVVLWVIFLVFLAKCSYDQHVFNEEYEATEARKAVIEKVLYDSGYVK
jgi:hypothetical protein